MLKIVTEEKNILDLECDNLTVIELLRVYSNQEGAKIAAWRREHPTKNPVLHIEGDNPKKILKAAIAAAQKDLDKYSEEFKKMK